jgi:IS5 family transposase
MFSNRSGAKRDWSAYNQALRERGSLTLWVDEEVVANWRPDHDPHKLGTPFLYSDSAIELILTLRAMYHLPLRGAEGFARSVFGLMGLSVPLPHYSTLSRRAGRLEIDLAAAPSGEGRVVLLDSTGLKVFGEGEWKVRQHGYSKRRTWRKLHVALDPRTQEVVACVLTENGVDDGSMAEPLLGEVGGKVKEIKADGAYDQSKVYRAAKRHGAKPIIPPRKNAKIKQHGNRGGPRETRDEHLREIRRKGRKRWKRESGYHERSLVETVMFRYKTILGDGLRARKFANQQAEARIGCKIINKVTQLHTVNNQG